MSLVPNTLQSAILASKSITGKMIDSQIKASTSSIPDPSQTGKIAWSIVTQLIYSDLDVNLSSNVSTFLNSMTVTYGGFPSVAIVPPAVFNFSALASSHGKIIDTNGKTKTTTLPPSAVLKSGELMMQTAFETIYAGLPSVIATAVSSALVGSTSIVPPGSAVLAGVPGPGVVAAPVPALVIPSVWTPVTLSTLLSAAFLPKAIPSGTKVDTSGKAKTATIAASAVSSAGAILWEEFITQLYLDISSTIPNLIKNYILLGNGSVFNIPPGTPITTPVFPFTGTSSVPEPASIT